MTTESVLAMAVLGCLCCLAAMPGAFGQSTSDAAAGAGGIERALVLEPGHGNPRNSEGDFIRLNDGRILFAYTHFTGSGGDEGTAHIAGRYSSDAGRTWTQEDVLILPNEGDQNTMSVSFLRLKDGRIAFLYLRKNSDYDCRPYIRFSNDEAKTWTDPILCAEAMGYFVVNNDRVVQLGSGRIVVPAARHSLPQEKFRRRGEGMCFLSDDAGKPWRPSETILQAPPESQSGLQEPGVVELKDGRLMMLCRTDMGCQYRSYSSDGGVTWSDAGPTDLLSPVSPATVQRIPKTGDLLVAWNNHKDIDPEHKGKRTPFTVAISRDEGKTWDHVRNLEDDPHGWYCYIAMEFVDDAVLLGLCAGDRRTGGLNRTEILRVPTDSLYK